MANIALTGWIWEYGGVPSANSIAVTPKDQMSVKLLYRFLEITSGDIQKGVPITVPLLFILFVIPYQHLWMLIKQQPQNQLILLIHVYLIKYFQLLCLYESFYSNEDNQVHVTLNKE